MVNISIKSLNTLNKEVAAIIKKLPKRSHDIAPVEIATLTADGYNQFYKFYLTKAWKTQKPLTMKQFVDFLKPKIYIENLRNGLHITCGHWFSLPIQDLTKPLTEETYKKIIRIWQISHDYCNFVVV